METHLRNFIAGAWESTDPNRFPGPQPISIERRHFPLLKKQPYMVCEKTDGMRVMLVSTTFEGKKLCVLVNRAFHVEEITLNVPRETILDCELIGNLILVYDAVLVKGVDVTKKPLTERLAAASSVTKMVLRTTKDKYTIKVKKMYPLAEIKTVLETEYPYETDGLVFTPINEPVRMGTHETMFKWKPRERITIDFLVRHTGQYFDRGASGKEPIMYMYIADRDKLKEIMIFNQLVKYKDLESYEGKVVECSYGNTGWQLEKVREDKTYPNNVRTYERTIVNLKEDIQANEFHLYMQK
jgi:mRNA capping enzyme, catalytic domain/mRNA capping enzyme, C-terminal domain